LKATCTHRCILIACLAWIAALLALVFSVVVVPYGATFPTTRPIQKQGVGKQRLLTAGACGLVLLARATRLHTSNFEADILRRVNQVPLGCQSPDHYLLTRVYLRPYWVPHVSDSEGNLLATAYLLIDKGLLELNNIWRHRLARKCCF
jgi:hypothetical protein